MEPYKKTKWVDHIVDRYTGQVIQQGTPLDQANMNHMEEGISENRDAIIAQEKDFETFKEKVDTTDFTPAEDRTALKSGDKLSVLFGKIAKWFADLKAVAFSGKYSDLSGTPTIPPAVAVKGNAEANYRTGDVNLTPADVGAVSKAGDTMTGDLYVSDGWVGLNYVPDNGGRVSIKAPPGFGVSSWAMDGYNGAFRVFSFNEDGSVTVPFVISKTPGGGPSSGNISVGNKISMRTDNEGGNIGITPPDGYPNYWEIDAFDNGNLRFLNFEPGITSTPLVLRRNTVESFFAGEANRVSNPLTFTGGVNDSYNGSEPKTIRIPSTAADIGALPVNGWEMQGRDYNTLVETGIYQIQGVSPNAPPFAQMTGYPEQESHFHILVFENWENWVRQIAFDVRSPKVWTRDRRDGIWYPWVELVNSSELAIRDSEADWAVMEGHTPAGNTGGLYFNKGGFVYVAVSDAQGVQLFGQELYSTGHRPTPADIGAVSKTGDTMTGDLWVANGMAGLYNVPDNGGRLCLVSPPGVGTRDWNMDGYGGMLRFFAAKTDGTYFFPVVISETETAINNRLVVGGKVSMWTDGEGGNIGIKPPDGYPNYWEIDAFDNGNLRFINFEPDVRIPLILRRNAAESYFAGTSAYATTAGHATDGSWKTGESVTLTNVTLSAHVTNGMQAIPFCLPVGKPISAPGVRVTQFTGKLRGVQGYLDGNSDDVNLLGPPYGVNARSFGDAGMVRLEVTKSLAWTNTVNNTPVTFSGDITIVFEFADLSGDEPMPGPEIFGDGAGVEGPSAAEPSADDIREEQTDTSEHTEQTVQPDVENTETERVEAEQVEAEQAEAEQVETGTNAEDAGETLSESEGMENVPPILSGNDDHGEV